MSERNDQHTKQFPLRLARSLKEAANHMAQREGISLNHFISLAVAEKVSRIETERGAASSSQAKLA